MAYGRCKHLDSFLCDSVHASTDINGARAADLAKLEFNIRERQEEREVLWHKEQNHYAKMRALHIADTKKISPNRSLDVFLRDSVRASSMIAPSMIAPGSMTRSDSNSSKLSSASTIVQDIPAGPKAEALPKQQDRALSPLTLHTQQRSKLFLSGIMSMPPSAQMIHGNLVQDDGLHEACETTAIQAGLLAILTVNMKKLKETGLEEQKFKSRQTSTSFLARSSFLL